MVLNPKNVNFFSLEPNAGLSVNVIFRYSQYIFCNIEQATSTKMMGFRSVHLPLIFLDKVCVSYLNYLLTLCFISFIALISHFNILVCLFISY